MRKKKNEKPSVKASVSQKKTRVSSKETLYPYIKKQYLKSNHACRVTFRLPKEAAQGAKHVMVVGDFNGWDTNVSPMKRIKTGDFKLTMNLPCNREYRFRYLIDGNQWENDWCADKYVPNNFGCNDSVVIVYPD